MPFKITITQTKKVTKNVGGEWVVVGQRVPNEEEIERLRRYSEDKPLTIGALNVHGDRPIVEREVEVDVKVLEQEVENLDLTAVIKAVNGIP